MGKRISKAATASDFTATATDTATTTTTTASVSSAVTVPVDTDAATDTTVEYITPTVNDVVPVVTKDSIKKHLKSLDDAVKTFKKGFLSIGFNLLWFKVTLA